MDAATISCPACSEAIPSGRAFCGQCGSPLAPRCPSCGAEIRVGVRFCEECGSRLTEASPPNPQPHSIVTPPSAAASVALGREVPDEERRLVTALFCDLVGFTTVSECLDPEEIRHIQSEYFSAMSSHITRFGGMVEKYAGDAVLALFGAPMVHEDDAERAVLCALAMQQAIKPVAASARLWYGVEIAIRVGVNSGEVVSGSWDASGQQQETVTGDPVNIAARLQAAAEIGGVLAGEETMRLARRRIRFGDEQLLTLKGKAEPVGAYAVLGVCDQLEHRSCSR